MPAGDGPSLPPDIDLDNRWGIHIFCGDSRRPKT